jgi:AcrR family transcriptional regulator
MEIPSKVKNKELITKRREQIILAAIKLFSKNGFHETSLRDLSEEAGISHGNIYDYVRTKEDIFYIMHEYMNNLAIEKIHASTANVKDPLDKLFRIIRAELEIMYEWSDAVLLIYQETHVLSRPLLRALLKKEREQVQILEETIEQCVAQKRIKKINPRLAANLIKSMVETWVSKRWDLKGHADRIEIEKAVISIVSDGLLENETSKNRNMEDEELRDKTALILNGSTALSKAISFYLLAKGATVVVQTEESGSEWLSQQFLDDEDHKKIKFCSLHDNGILSLKLLEGITKDIGAFDIFIHDLGINRVRQTNSENKGGGTFFTVQENLANAQKIAPYLHKRVLKSSSGRIIYFAPLAWDRQSAPVEFDIAKAATIELTKSVSKIMAPALATVNCIIPGFIGEFGGGDMKLLSQTEEKSQIPLGFIGDASDVLETLDFLISYKSRYLTGQILNVSGGMEN